MKLAVNYSPQAARLVERGEIAFGLYKCPDWPDLLAEAGQQRPCYVHWGFRAGTHEFGDVDWSEVLALRASTNTLAVNLHLCPRATDFEGMSVDTTEAKYRTAVIDAMVEDIEVVVSNVGRENVVLENVPHDPEPPWFVPRPAFEASVIREVIEQVDCGMILDVSHAAISALHLGVDAADYVAELPTDRMRELHITGLSPVPKGWSDHYPMREEDWALLERALQRIRVGDWPTPWVVAFEYGGVGPGYESRSDESVLAEQVPRMLECVRGATAN